MRNYVGKKEGGSAKESRGRRKDVEMIHANGKNIISAIVIITKL